MNISEKIRQRIEMLDAGEIFQYDIFELLPSEFTAAAKAIERLIRKGTIRRISTGKFYKPKQSVFGELKPGDLDIIQSYLYKNGKRVAYITGILLYNSMGLTTQIPRIITLSSRDRRINSQIGATTIKSVKSYVDINERNVKYLEVLDAIKDFKTIPDLNQKSAIQILRNKLKNFGEKGLAAIQKYSLKYPPRAIALLGALLNSVQIDIDTGILKNKLNPLSKYYLRINPGNLASVSEWNII